MVKKGVGLVRTLDKMCAKYTIFNCLLLNIDVKVSAS